MHSFPPGTEVQAELPNKRKIWRFAKVVEPEPNHKPDPAVVYVVFRGKTKKVQRTLKQVKLREQYQPSPALAVDLTSDIPPEQTKSKSLPTYSDPWDPNSPKPAPSKPSNSNGIQSELPFSPPARTNPRPPIQNLPSSSRDHVIPYSHPHHHVNQIHAQLVRDPSLPTYSNHEPSSWLAQRRPPPIENPPYPLAPLHDQHFVSEPFTTNPNASYFTPLHNDSNAPRVRSHPLPEAPPPQIPTSYPHLNPRQPPKAPGRSNANPPHLNSALFPPGPLPYSSTSQVPQKNGFTSRADDRHPFGSVDKTLRIPRAAPSRNEPRREPRHPQSVLDDDVRIPRNIRRSRPGTSMDEGFSDNPKNSYPTSKRQRLVYGYDIMPPPSRTEAASLKLSRRLAKREFGRYDNHREDGPSDNNPPSLPYQRCLTGEENDVTIAPSFSSLESGHDMLPNGTSDDETNLLKEVFTGLSLGSADSFLGSAVEHHESAKRVPPLAVRSGTRKKNRPKRLRALSHDEKRLDLGDCPPTMDTVTSQELKSVNRQRDSEFPVPRVFGCSCPENDKQLLQHQDTIQCCRCSLWLHNECAGFEIGDLGHIQNGLQEENANFICVQCLDDQLSLAPGVRSVQQHLSSEGTIWFSSIPRITKRMRGLGITATDPRQHDTATKERGLYKRHWLREPLREDEKAARLNNLERLREGVVNASVGAREREVLDAMFMKGPSAGGI